MEYMRLFPLYSMYKRDLFEIKFFSKFVAIKLIQIENSNFHFSQKRRCFHTPLGCEKPIQRLTEYRIQFQR